MREFLRLFEKSKRTQPEFILRPAAPTSINELLGQRLAEDAGMDLGDTPLLPFQVEGSSRGQFGIVAIIAHPLQGPQLLQYFNRFVPVKKDLTTPEGIRSVSVDVGSDWAYMISPTTAGRQTRKDLEKAHAPRKVAGFAQFRPHVKQYVDALGDQGVIRHFFNIPVENRPIYPLLYLEVGRKKLLRRDRRIRWHDKLMTEPQLTRINAAIAHYATDHSEVIPLVSASPDTFLGLTLAAYVHPTISYRWEPSQYGQPMSIAQGPVHAWQHKGEFDREPIVTRLIDHVMRSR